MGESETVGERIWVEIGEGVGKFTVVGVSVTTISPGIAGDGELVDWGSGFGEVPEQAAKTKAIPMIGKTDIANWILALFMKPMRNLLRLEHALSGAIILKVAEVLEGGPRC